MTTHETTTDGTYTRSFDAAGRRISSSSVLYNLNSSIGQHAATVARRAAYFARNDAHASRAVDVLVSNTVGCGIKPRSRHPDPAVRESIHELWDRWTEACTPDGQSDFYGLQALSMRALVESGESFARLGVGDGSGDVPLWVHLIDSAQVPRDIPLSPSASIRHGVEYDAAGRRVAYHVLPEHPGDPWINPFGLIAYQPVRVPAADMLHVLSPWQAGQVRGVSWLAPVLLAVNELGSYRDAALVRARALSLICGALTTPDGDGIATTTEDEDGGQVLAMQPGTIIPLPPGKTLQFFSPTGDTNYEAFVRAHLRSIAVGLGVTYEQISGDMSGANYSSARVALIEFRRRISMIQHTVLVHQFCRPIWRRFVSSAVLSGALPAADFAGMRKYMSVDWLPPRWDWVDPVKDIQAEVQSIANHLKSRSQVIAEMGYDAEVVDAQIVADRERERALDLVTSPTDTKPEGSSDD